MEKEFGIAGLANVRELDTGGNATVFLAQQPDLDRTVVLKLIDRGESEATERRFERERRAMGRLSQVTGIAPVYDSGFASDGRPYLIMPYYPAGSLLNLIERNGKLSPERVRRIGITVAKALQAAHEHGVIHRDIKPGNVLIDNDGEPQVADFGIARLLDADGGTSVTLTITALYSAPEAMTGKPSTVTSDVYSLGSTLYTAISGSPAFSRGREESLPTILTRVATEDPAPLDPAIPLELRNAIMRAMSRNPDDRYQSCAEFASALEQLGSLSNEVSATTVQANAHTSVLTAQQQAELTETSRKLSGSSSKAKSGEGVTATDDSAGVTSRKFVAAAVAAIIALTAGFIFLRPNTEQSVTTSDAQQSVTTSDGAAQIDQGSTPETTTNPGDRGISNSPNTGDSSTSASTTAADDTTSNVGGTDSETDIGSEAPDAVTTPTVLPSPTPTPTAAESAIAGIGRYSATAFLHACKGIKKVPATLMPAAPGSLDGDGSLVFSADYSTWWVELDSTVEVFDEALPNLDAAVIQMDTASLVNLAEPADVGDTVYLPSLEREPIEATLRASSAHNGHQVLETVDGSIELFPGQAVASSDGELLGYVARNDLGEYHVSRRLVSEATGNLDFGECGARPTDEYQYLGSDWDSPELPDAASQLLLIQNLVEMYAKRDWQQVRAIESTERSDEELSRGWANTVESFVIARAKGPVNPRGTAEWAIGVASYEVVDGTEQTRFLCYSPRVNTGKGNAVLGNVTQTPDLVLDSFEELLSARTPEPNVLIGHIDVADLFLLSAYSCTGN